MIVRIPSKTNANFFTDIGTVSAHIERWRCIKIYKVQTSNSGHCKQLFVQRYCTLWTESSKNDHSVSHGVLIKNDILYTRIWYIECQRLKGFVKDLVCVCNFVILTMLSSESSTQILRILPTLSRNGKGICTNTGCCFCDVKVVKIQSQLTNIYGMSCIVFV